MQLVKIFDTTLRDGEQSPGCAMSKRQKVRIALQLEALGVDIIEAGFPISSDGAFEAVQQVAKSVQHSTIAALARCQTKDIETAAKALEPAAHSRLHVFIATSPLHRQYKLKMSTAEVIEHAVKGVEQARQWCDDIEFSAEDAIRTEPEFLAQVLEAVINAGATTVNVPDTVGYATPDEMAERFQYLQQHVKNIQQAVLSCHCHNDLGLATANSLAAVQHGARQVECTINGIGERAGNCALEEIVMALKTRADHLQCTTNIRTPLLLNTSRRVAAVTGQFIPRHKAIVGENAFAHESGIHQHGILANRETYEIMRPEDVGMTHSELVLGKHSGRHAVANRCRELGYQLDEEALERLYTGFKTLADKKQRIFDADLEALLNDDQHSSSPCWSLVSLRADSHLGESSTPTASLVLRHQNKGTVREAATGDGPVDAICKAIQRATKIQLKLTALAMRNITEGEDAQGEAQIRAQHIVDGQAQEKDSTEYRGHGVSTDIVAACALALLNIINTIERQSYNTKHQAA